MCKLLRRWRGRRQSLGGFEHVPPVQLRTFVSGKLEAGKR